MININYYKALGLCRYQTRRQLNVVVTETNNETIDNVISSTNEWQALKKKALSCVACQLHNTRTNVVFGVGNENANLMIIGEAPGFYEDQKGEPFVGRAGQLLNSMLQAIQLERSDVYIANIIKCRPPNNRDPQINEINTCTPYLVEQIKHIKPKLLLAVGRIAGQYLLKNKATLESMRQKIFSYGIENTPLMVTYHPAYLLRNLIDKRKSYMDLKFVKNFLRDLK